MNSPDLFNDIKHKLNSDRKLYNTRQLLSPLVEHNALHSHFYTYVYIFDNAILTNNP